ncbi:helix-turn-helix domain-containing protein [Myxococcota bacterium]
MSVGHRKKHGDSNTPQKRKRCIEPTPLHEQPAMFLRPAVGPWLNADQAVRYLNLPSRKALYQAVRRGHIPARRLGKRLRFSALELDKVLAKRR